MNDKKISFIMCYNNEYFMNECKLYLDELVIPDGFEVEIVGITGAKSMTAGYNEGMRKSDAKYKIYMHQDVFITNKNFLVDLLELFGADETIGMVGMVGTPYMVKDGTMWHGIRVGGFYKLQEYMKKDVIHRFFPLESGYMEVEAIDGLLMATQYDVSWREDLFCKWDFYDVSQSFEFLKAGYKVVVPGQKPEWYIHDCGIISLQNYDDEREKFLTYYAEFMEERQGQDWEKYLNVVRAKINEDYRGSESVREYLLRCLDGLTDV